MIGLNLLKKILRHFRIPFYTVEGCVPQDGELFLLNHTFSLEEAIQIAEEFVAENPTGFEANILRDGWKVRSVGTV
jgi:hypothetical protein